MAGHVDDEVRRVKKVSNLNSWLAGVLDLGRVDQLVPDGKFHRVKTGGSRSSNGWYIVRDIVDKDGKTVTFVWAGDWKTGAKYEAYHCDGRAMAGVVQQGREQLHKDYKAEAERQAAQAAQRAEVVRANYPRPMSNNYLYSKGVEAVLPIDSELRTDDRDTLFVPCFEFGQTGLVLKGYQRIYGGGGKFFLAGQATSGCFHYIGADSDVILFCEGYATGATLHLATGYRVVVAFNCGNLMAVVGAWLHRFKGQGKQFIVCADDDWCTKGNPGYEAGSACFAYYKTGFCWPKFKEGMVRGTGWTDFNDLAAVEGLGAVASQIEAELKEDSWLKGGPYPYAHV